MLYIDPYHLQECLKQARKAALDEYFYSKEGFRERELKNHCKNIKFYEGEEGQRHLFCNIFLDNAIEDAYWETQRNHWTHPVEQLTKRLRSGEIEWKKEETINVR